MTVKTEITRDDIMDMAEYGAIRKQRRREMIEKKKQRRVAIGPDATAHFEDYDSMWLQVHEMLYIEKGGEEQLAEELSAYNPLVPKGRELVCTVLFEIDDPDRRARVLGGLGGVEETMFLRVDGEDIMGQSEEDLDRTNAAGKASSVQFIHFPFTDAQVEKFRKPDAEVIVGFKHPNYGHMVRITEDTRKALEQDFS
ncbi:MAG: DUF3501 family protein [Alphaproteobacteria bacterium]|jgi:hypothetical protein|nr:DUF3501 family protein [Alphaproteobacteria bacterium]